MTPNSTRANFNLLEKNWIPCLWEDTHTSLESVQTVLHEAQAIQEVRDPSPLVTGALHRFLLAILHRVLAPSDINAWMELFADGRGHFPRAPLETYFETWHDRFDLFHPEQPFYQTIGIEDKAPGPISRLFHERSSGNNPTLFDHSHTSKPISVSPAQAAAGLVTLQQFDLGGLKGFKEPGSNRDHNFYDTPHVRYQNVYLRGANLFQTLMYNLLTPLEIDESLQTGQRDTPAWERTDPVKPVERIPEGYVDFLTYQARRVFLAPPIHGDNVSEVTVAQGYWLPEGSVILDPLKAYRRDPEQGLQPLRFEEDRAVWRDSHVLLHLSAGTEHKSHRGPRALNLLARAQTRGAVLIPARAMVVGAATERGRATILLWRCETLPVPPELLDNPDCIAVLELALRQAERTAYELRRILREVARQLSIDPQAEKTLGEPLIREAGNRYWSALEVSFTPLLRAISSDPDEALDHWFNGVRSVGLSALEAVLERLGQTAEVLRVRAEAEIKLQAALSKLATLDIGQKTTEKGDST